MLALPNLLQMLQQLQAHYFLFVFALALLAGYLVSEAAIKFYRIKGTLPCAHQNIAGLKIREGKAISEKNRATHGSIYVQRDGCRYEVVLTRPEQLKAYFSKNARDHKKIDSFGAGEFLVSLLGQCLGFMNGAPWVKMRNLFNSHFSHSVAVRTLPAMTAFVSSWIEEYSSDLPGVVDPVRFVSDVPFTCIAQYLYGEKLCSGQKLIEMKELVPLHSSIIAFAFSTFWGKFKLYQCFNFQKVRELKYFQHRFGQLSLQMVKDSHLRGKDTVASSLHKHIETGELTFDNWLQTLDEILFANIDVTATVMAWSLVEMSLNLEEQERLREEILNQKGNSDAYVTRNDTLLHRVFFEVLRLHPLLWYGFPEESPHEITIDGHKIAPHTPIVIDQYQLNYNSEIWNPPDKPAGFGHVFCPDRFIGITNRDAVLSNATFGSGPRRCLGKNFAETLIKTLLIEILSRFEIVISGPVEYATDTFVVQPCTNVRLNRLL